MSQWMQDVRYALRQMRRAPGFAVTAVLTLGLGIGATATMYSVVHDVLLAQLPYAAHDRLVGIGFTFPQQKPNAEDTGVSADFVVAHSRSFESLGVSDDSSYEANLSNGGAGGKTLRVASTKVSQGYFATLGVLPVLGRNFTAQEDLPNGPKVAILSYWVWQRTFGGDAAMQTVIDDTVAAPRFFSLMASGFAGFAVLLTAIGLFGLLSYQVTQRTREIGVRLAVGSSRLEILLLILKRGLILTAMGVVIGAVASLAVPRVAASVLADNVFTGNGEIGSVLSNSLAALGLAAMAMLIAATLASYLPARRAAAVEPMEALRAE